MRRKYNRFNYTLCVFAMHFYRPTPTADSIPPDTLPSAT